MQNAKTINVFKSCTLFLIHNTCMFMLKTTEKKSFYILNLGKWEKIWEVEKMDKNLKEVGNKVKKNLGFGKIEPLCHPTRLYV